jgi:general stress protein YciG
MNKQEAGRKGGLTTVAKYGKAFMREIGRKGFLATLNKPNGPYIFWHLNGFRKSYNEFKHKIGR